jgi:hypothetical protein
MRVCQGILSETTKGAELKKVANWSFLDGGLSQHSCEDIQSLFVYKVWLLRFAFETNEFVFYNHGTRDTLRD